MPFPAEVVRQLAKQQLGWMDRNMTFRKTLKLIPMLSTAPNEYAVYFLVGELLNHVRLFLLSTERIYSFGALGRIDPVGWDGRQITMLTVHGNQAVRINLVPGVTGGGHPDYVDISKVNGSKANTFINLTNWLCVNDLWGNPDTYFQQVQSLVERFGGSVSQ